MSLEKFQGVRENFAYFTFNRNINLQHKNRESKRNKMLEQEGSTFAPEINNASKEIANNLMLKYYGKGFKKQ